MTDDRVAPEGEAQRWMRLRAPIRALIEIEDAERPLDDSTLAAMLCFEGLDVRRRTVTKIRKQLGIASSRQRGAV